MHFARHTMACLAIVLPLSSVLAQPAQLPKDIAGRWSLPGTDRSNLFSLDGIAAAPDGTSFTAALTWWTTDPKCSVRNEPVSGKVTASGMSFDAKTKCGVEFTAVLQRTGAEWAGQATTKGGNSTVVELKAK